MTRAQAADLSSKDKAFFMKASQGGMTEVAAGKVAEEKASSQDVKDFGAMMVKDHSENDNDLMALAEAKGVKLDSSLDATHQTKVDDLSKMSGAAFDKAYIADMVAGHKKMLALMKKEESSDDADLKAFATKTAPVVEMHLTKAEAIEKSMK